MKNKRSRYAVLIITLILTILLASIIGDYANNKITHYLYHDCFWSEKLAGIIGLTVNIIIIITFCWIAILLIFKLIQRCRQEKDNES